MSLIKSLLPLLIALLVSFNIAASTVYSEAVTPVINANDANITLLDVSPDENKVVFSAKIKLPGSDAHVHDSNNIYVRDLKTNKITRITKPINGRVLFGTNKDAQFISNDKVAFLSEATNLHPDAKRSDRKLFIFDTKRSEISYVNTESIYGNIMKIIPSSSKESVYIAFTDAFRRYDLASKAWVTLIDEQRCGFKVFAISKAEDILYQNDCQSNIVLIDKNNNKLVDTIQKSSASDVALSSDGRTIITFNKTSVDIYSKGDGFNSKRTLQLDQNMYFQVKHGRRLPHSKIKLNHNGSLALLYLPGYPDFTEQSYMPNLPGPKQLFLLDTNNGKLAKISTYANSDWSASGTAFFSESGQKAYFSAAICSGYRYKCSAQTTIGGYKFTLKPDFFSDKNYAISSISLNSSTAFSVKGVIQSNADAFMLKRYNKHLSQRFIIHSKQFNDHRFGLTNDNYNYQFIPCDKNLRCSKANVIEKSILVSDFSSPAQLNFELSTDNNANQQTYQVKLTAAIDKSADSLKVINSRTTREFRLKNRESKLTPLNTHGDDIYLYHACIENYDESNSCSSRVNSLRIELPRNITQTHLTAKPLPDFSAIKVTWPKISGYRYTLLKADENGHNFQGVAKANNGFWLDKSIVPGQTSFYRLEVCNETLCNLTPTIRVTPERKEKPVQLGLDTSLRNNLHLLIKINTSYAYDSLKLYRSSNTKRKQLLAVLPVTAEKYLDTDFNVREKQNYWLVACYQGSCSQSELMNPSFTADNLFTFPPPVQELKVSPSPNVVTANISWKKANNVDGYRITAISKSGFHPSFDKYQSWDVSDSNIVQTSHNLDGDFIGNIVEYHVQSYVKLGNDHIHSAPKKVTYFNRKVLARKYSEAIELSLSKGQRIDEAPILVWQNANLTRSLYLYRKKSSQGNAAFEQVYADTSPRIGSHGSFRDESVKMNVNYDYKLVSCSYLATNCYESRVDNITTLATLALPNSQSKLVLGWKGINQVEIETGLPENEPGRIIELKRIVNGSDFKTATIYRGPSVASFIDNITHPYHRGDEITYKIKHCVNTSDFHCGKWGGDSSLTIPAIFKLPPKKGKISVNVNDTEQLVEIVMSAERLQDPEIATERVELYQAQNAKAFELVHNLNWSQAKQGNISVQLKTLKAKQHYSYKARFCNSVGCSDYTWIRSIYLKASNQRPPIPNVVSISNTYLNSLELSLQVLNTNNHGIQHRIYQADSASSFNNEFATFSTYWYRATELQPGKTYYFKVQSCYGSTGACSAFSPIVKAKTATNTTKHINLSGSYLWSNSHFRAGNLYYYRGKVEPRYKKLDTLSGELYTNQWMSVDTSFETKTTAYLNTGQQSCSTLLENNLVISGLGSSRYEHALFRVIYTGNGCSHKPGLEAYQLYIDSSYLASPIKIEDKESALNNWNDFSVRLNSERKVGLYHNGKKLNTPSVAIERVFDFVKLSWKTNSNSAVSDLIATSKSNSTVPKQLQNMNSLYVDSIHPRIIEVRFSFAHSNMYFKLWNPKVGLSSTSGNWQARSGRESYKYLDQLPPGQEHTYLLQLCQESSCGPLFAIKSNTPTYYEIKRGNLDQVDAPNVGEVSLKTTSELEKQADTLTLFRANSKDGQYQTIQTIQALEALSTRPYFIWTDTGLAQNATYFYKLKACNPINCYTTPVRKVTTGKDSDGDGVIDSEDAFPHDPKESKDNDLDGIGDNADLDDDNDLMPDDFEEANGLSRNFKFDAVSDNDGDGYFNVLEYLANSNISDANETPKHKGLFISFEQGEENPLVMSDEYEVIDHYSYRFIHGAKILRKKVTQPSTFSFTFGGTLAKGKAFVFFRRYCSTYDCSPGLKVTVDSKQKPLLNLPDPSFTLWSIMAAEVSENEQKLKFDFSLNQDLREVVMDAIFIPSPDTDKDGYIDILDHYPEDPNKWLNVSGYTDSKQAITQQNKHNPTWLTLDSDQDGFSNKFELQSDSDPLDPLSTPATDMSWLKLLLNGKPIANEGTKQTELEIYPGIRPNSQTDTQIQQTEY